MITSGSMTATELAERVAAMPPLELLGTGLMRDSEQGIAPTREAIVQATNQAVEYRHACTCVAGALATLAPIVLPVELDFSL